MSLRPVLSTTTATPTLEGAGVHYQTFGFSEPTAFDPFLLLMIFATIIPHSI